MNATEMFLAIAGVWLLIGCLLAAILWTHSASIIGEVVVPKWLICLLVAFWPLLVLGALGEWEW